MIGWPFAMAVILLDPIHQSDSLMTRLRRCHCRSFLSIVPDDRWPTAYRSGGSEFVIPNFFADSQTFGEVANVFSMCNTHCVCISCDYAHEF